MKMISLPILALVSFTAAAGTTSATQRVVSLTQEPVVMRINKDEFRIAFGINGERCGEIGCSGMIRYRVNWKTADGIAHTELKHVHFTVAPNSPRTIAVDRQYFDTAEGQHTTDIVKVSVDSISYRDGIDLRTAQNERL